MQHIVYSLTLIDLLPHISYRICSPASACLSEQAFMHAKGIRRPLEVETRTLEELQEVLALLDASAAAAAPGNAAGAAGAGDGSGGGSSGSMITRIMLDNMTKKDVAAPGGRCCVLLGPDGV
jgi:hypothetical protein